ncbi:MAG: hypothetical protein ACREXW_13235 [Gammaproteobacteria bacterium]
MSTASATRSPGEALLRAPWGFGGHPVSGTYREQGLTVLLVEQKLPFARRVADRFCLMERGRLVAGGAIGEMHEELVRRHLTV